MRMELKRLEKKAGYTIGVLLIDGVRECFTLEDEVREDGVKIYGETAIPQGIYKVDITMSPRFKRPLPLLLGVKNFEGIRIHPGNTADDTEGCILVGESKGQGQIFNSRKAFDKVFDKIQAAKTRKEPIVIEIS